MWDQMPQLNAIGILSTGNDGREQCLSLQVHLTKYARGTLHFDSRLFQEKRICLVRLERDRTSNKIISAIVTS